MSVLSAALMLFIVMDPLGNLPLFVAALAEVQPERRMRIVLRESLIALAILGFFLAFGRVILSALGISEVALRLGGGIILFLIAVRMIFPVEGGIFGSATEGEPLIVPLAIPLIAGPSSLSLVLLLAADESLGGFGALSALGLAWVAATAIHLLADPLRRIAGPRSLTALERLMGLVLAVLAIQMMLDGLVQVEALQLRGD